MAELAESAQRAAVEAARLEEERRLAAIAAAKLAAEAAARKEEERRLAAIAAAERRAGYWRQIYLAAINGKDHVAVANLHPDDELYFDDLWFHIRLTSDSEEDLCRSEDDILQEIDFLTSKKAELQQKIKKFQKRDYSLDHQEALIWDLEWLCERLEELNVSLAQVKDRDFAPPALELETIHVLTLPSPAGPKNFYKEGEFSIGAALWFCSTSGQQALENFEAEVKKASGAGRRVLELNFHETKGGFTINCFGGVKCKFPSFFDFTEALRLLGYSLSVNNHGATGTVTVSW